MHDNQFSQGIRRRTPQCVVASVFKNQRNGFRQIFSTFFNRAPLSISAGNFRRIGNEPIGILFNDGSKFVPHSPPPLLKSTIHAPSRIGFNSSFVGFGKMTFIAMCTVRGKFCHVALRVNVLTTRLGRM